MARPPRFARREVEDAALAVLDERGAGGLTTRAVAERLGTGPMTLYRHIESSADLEALAVEAALRGLTVPDPAGADWRDDVRAIARGVFDAVRPHPNVIPLVLARRGRSESFLATAEALLAALARSGRRGADLLVAFRAVATLATAFAQTDLAGPLADEPGDAMIDRFETLPPDRYARLVELAATARGSDAAAEFARSLDLLIAGLDAEPVSSRRAPRAPRRP